MEVNETTKPDIEQMGAFYAALSKAQGEFKEIPKTKTVDFKMKNGGRQQYSYADLADVRRATQKGLSDNGLCIIQHLYGPMLVTRLACSSGGYIESSMPINLNQDVKSLGSQITYFRRYALCAILGVVADEDVDGDAQDTVQAAPRKPNPPPKPVVVDRTEESKGQNGSGTGRDKKNDYHELPDQYNYDEGPSAPIQRGSGLPNHAKNKEFLVKRAKENKWNMEEVQFAMIGLTEKNKLDALTADEYDKVLEWVSNNSPQDEMPLNI